MNKVIIVILLCIVSSCKMNKPVHTVKCKAVNDSTEQFCDQSEGLLILDTLGKVYGNEPYMSGLSLESPNCPDFIEGVYFDKADLVFQVTGDTAVAREILEKASGGKNFKLEPVKDGNYSQKQLYAVLNELRKKLEASKYENINRNVIGYGVGLHHIEISLIMNTPERRKEFREKIMDSPTFRFNGVEVPVINEKVGVSHAQGVYIRPEYPVYSIEATEATFILDNYSGKTIECGEHYYVTYEDEKGIWRELPMNTVFFDIAYGIQDKTSWTTKASLNPDVHPNKPGRYRYFYQISIGGAPILMMAEFRLTANEKEWKEAKKTPLPEGLLKAKQENGSQLMDENSEEPIYEVVESVPEFPNGGLPAMVDFIKKNIKYPEVARKNGVEGRVIVKVVIDKDGSVTDPVVVRSVDPYLDKEALRVIRLMPKWKPGTQSGKKVKVYFTLPVAFQLDGALSNNK